MANTQDLAALVSSELKAAIKRSESHNEIVSVAITMISDIGTVAAHAADYADNVDYANEGDGTYDMWGWSNEMEAAGKGDMQWRLRVTIAASSQYRFENGKLFKLDGNAYVHCYSSIYATTEDEAIRLYEQSQQ